MAQDDHVGIEGLDVLGRVAEGFPLGRAGGRGVEGDHVRTEELGGHLEGQPRAGARFEEEVDDRLAAQGRDLLDLAVEDAPEGAGGRQQLLDLGEGEFLDGEEVFSIPGHGGKAVAGVD